MAEAAQGGGDPILMIRGVLDMTQPYQELQNLGRSANEGTTFSNSGTPGTSSNNAARERASRAVERQGDVNDAEQASFNVSNRERTYAFERRKDMSVWGDANAAGIGGPDVDRPPADSYSTWGAVNGPTGGGVIRAHGKGDTDVRSTGPARRAYQKNKYSQDWESQINEWGESASNAAIFAAGTGGAGFDFPHRIPESSTNFFDVNPNVSMGPSRREEMRARKLKAQNYAGNQFDFPDRLPESDTNFFDVNPNVIMGSNRRDAINARRSRQRSLLKSTSQWQDGGAVSFDQFDTENFGANLDEAIADADSKQPVVPRSSFKEKYNKIMRGGTNPLNSNLSYFGRFMAIEGIRSATALGNAGRSYNLGNIAAKGDLTAEAENELQFRNNIANSMPLGIGELARLIRDPSGADEGTVRGTINYTEAQEQIGASRATARRAFASLGREAGVSGTGRGTSRTVAEIEASRADRQATLIADTATTGKLEETAHKARLTALQASYGVTIDAQGRGQATNDPFGKYSGEVAAENKSYQTTLANASARSTASQNYINLVAANQTRDTLNDAANTVQSSVQSGVLAYSQSFRTEMPDASNFNSIRFAQRQRSRQRQFGFEQYITQQDAEMRDEATKDPLTAPFKRFAHYGERAFKSAANAADENQDRLDTDLQIRSGNQQYEAAGNMSRARMSRDTRGIIATQFQGSMNEAGNLPPEMQKSARDAAQANRDEQLQNLNDRQLALGGHQALALAVSGMQAQAFGPGANAMRRQASTLSIAGGAEEQAQGFLRDSSLGNDKERLGFADNARQLGINQLNTYKANYIQGFRSRSVGVQEIAPGNQDSAEPGKVLRGIDDGVDSLKAKLGSSSINSAGGANSMVPALIQQIIELIRNGSVGGATP